MDIQIHHYIHFVPGEPGTSNPLSQLSQISDQLTQVLGALAGIEDKENLIMATLAEFQTKIDTINANTTASAAAAAGVAQILTDLRSQIAQALADAGVPASDEANILGQLDTAVSTSSALKTFLEATAASGTEPKPVPAPAPVEG